MTLGLYFCILLIFFDLVGLVSLKSDAAQVDIRLRRTDDTSYRTATVSTGRLQSMLQEITSQVPDCVISGVFSFTNRCRNDAGRISCTRVAVLETDADANAVSNGDFIEVGCAESFFFKETFDDNWQTRWQWASKFLGRWKHRPPRHCNGTQGPREADKGLATSSDRQLHVIAAPFKEFRTRGKDFVVHYQVKFEQTNIGCSGGYLKLFPKGFHRDNVRGGDFALMFGPDVCPDQNKSSLVIQFNKKAEPLYFPMELPDQTAHTYTLVIHQNNTFRVFIDLQERLMGTLDPYASRPRELPVSIVWVSLPLLTRKGFQHVYAFDSISCIAFDIYQEYGGTLFDNIYLSDDIDSAFRFARRTWDKGCNIAHLAQRAVIERDLQAWYAQNSRALHGFKRAVHATVMVAASKAGPFWGTCLMLTSEGHLLCNSHPFLEASHGVISVALNGPDSLQQPQVLYLARMLAEDDSLSLVVLQLDTTCCEDFRPLSPGNLNVALTSWHTHPSVYKIGKKVLVLCMSDPTNQAPSLLTTTEATIEGLSGRYVRLVPAPDCSGGVIVDEDGVFLGLGELTNRRPAPSMGYMTPVTAMLHLFEIAQREARGDNTGS